MSVNNRMVNLRQRIEMLHNSRIARLDGMPKISTLSAFRNGEAVRLETYQRLECLLSAIANLDLPLDEALELERKKAQLKSKND